MDENLRTLVAGSTSSWVSKSVRMDWSDVGKVVHGHEHASAGPQSKGSKAHK